ncbi:RNA polymerase II transcription factorb subunit 3 [Rhodotorula toruloides]|uniref:RNA polymerase II transcription factor B subunit 3 n=1 Tax=Rhodotorula toruloides TaxID=5286 RepID=A0A511KNF9_RHOTO|nr:RNA polymerase II transcription factorb subunit 3 [Rhodotorula toruloides]
MAAPKPRFFLGSKRGGAAPSSASRTSTPSSSARATPSSSKAPPPPADAPILGADGDRRMQEFSSPDDVCPVCKVDRYLNPKLRLMVSKCYHKMCESCLDRLFSLGPEPCPVCGQTIRKSQFQPQIFENLEVQKEVAVRKRTAKIFNKSREDFASDAAYNDYLEEYESITFSLIHAIGSDLAATEAKIRAYELQNRQSIEDNEERREREKMELEAREKGEREWRELERRRYMEEEERVAKEKEADRRKVLQLLESGTADAASIVAASRKRSSARDAFLPTDDSSIPRLKFLANLTNKSHFTSSEPEEPLDALNSLDNETLYDSYDALYTIFPRLSVARESGGKSYDPGTGALVKEAGMADEGGFMVEEVWEKAVRSAVAGLWDAPLGWQEADADVEGNGVAASVMQVDVAG